MCTVHICPGIQYLLYVVPRQFKKRPAERKQHAKAVGNRDNFIKIDLYVCIR